MIQVAETTGTGLDKMAEMDLDTLIFWCQEVRGYLSARADAERRAMEGS
uniref:Uncharacterized protein n=1 Tax=Candidatus Kentrum sp. LFY TaxID=2126342 RepID=A0A450WGR6_9GAMM|nr:MAG: hypothetical protein BECKLFY1418C_GA0070996_102232 [Candidatus Kentron sp. LFY]